MATTRSPRSDTRDERPDAEAPSARAVQADRKKRVPLGVPRPKLTVPKRPGYERRWVNEDSKGRLQAALEGGYTHVTDPNLKVGEDGGASSTDSRVSRIVGRGEGGKPLRAFLMEIPSELFKEDQASKQGALDEVDRAIRKGSLVSEGEQHRYVPKQGIRVEKETTRGASEEDDLND